MYLKIENNVATDYRAFTVLGLSTTRGTPGIGQFGSGTKHAITLLLRKGIDFTIVSNNTRIKFGTRDDEFDGVEYKRVVFQVTGDSEDSGWALSFGELDWQDTNMALREFVSNALDKSGVEGTQIEYVEEVCDCEGTAVYIEATDEVKLFFQNIDRHFLHFKNQDKTFVPAQTDACGVYRRGVLVRELGKSLFDYNIDIKIDECRNSNEYTIKAEIAKSLGGADVETIKVLLEKFPGNLEENLDGYYLSGSQFSTECRDNWKLAFSQLYGDKVACSCELQADKIAIRGLTGIVIDNNGIYAALKAYGVTTADQYLTAADYRETLEPNKADMTRFHECLKILKCNNPPSIRRTSGCTELQGETLLVGCASKAKMLAALANYIAPGGASELLATRLLRAVKSEDSN